MQLHPTEVKTLVAVEQALGKLAVAPAEYEVIRRVVAATGDFDFVEGLVFSSDGLKSGAAALASRTAILVDVPAVQVAVMPTLQTHFANPIYCCDAGSSRPQRDKPAAMLGLERLSLRYPNSIVVVGQTASLLSALTDLVERKMIHPALIIATPPDVTPPQKEHSIEGSEQFLHTLQQAGIPYVCSHRKGNAIVAASVLIALMEMAWQAYGQDPLTTLVSR